MVDIRSKKGLPEGWIKTKLGNLCEVVRGGSPRPMGSPKYFNGNIPFIKISDVTKINTKNIYDSNTKVNEAGSKKSRLLPKGSLILSNSGTICVPKFLGVDACIHDGFVSFLNLDNAVSKEYLFHFFHFIRPYIIQKHKQGVTQVNLNTKIVSEFDFLFPPTEEQHHIVVKIEELFSELDNGIENLKKAREQLKIYRQAVLKYAFEGKLNKEWRTQQKRAGNPPEPAEKLLEQIKVEREKHFKKQLEDWKRACEQAKADGKKKPASPKKPKELSALTERELAELPELPFGWGWIKSGNLFSFVTSGSRGWAKYYSSNGSIFIRIANLDFDSLKIDLKRDNIQFVKPPSGAEGTRTKTEKGDFLFSITGYLGMFAITPDLGDSYINQHIALARPFNGFNKEYVGYYCIAKTGGFFHLNKNQKGATKAGLTLEDIRTFPIPLCPVSEQQQTVSEIESRLSICDQLEQTIEDSLKKAEALRQSILKKAFAGELTKDWRGEHPELITGENSAKKLLEKIKAEKALSIAIRKKPQSKKMKSKKVKNEQSRNKKTDS